VGLKDEVAITGMSNSFGEMLILIELLAVVASQARAMPPKRPVK
jgi:hypothetical protein